jgi:hypothetical protein
VPGLNKFQNNSNSNTCPNLLQSKHDLSYSKNLK